MKPPGPPGMHAKWRVIAIANKDPHKFAEQLQEALQEGADQNWQMMSREYRGEACIITWCRVEPATQPEQETRPPATSRRIVSQSPKGEAYQEVLYSFQLVSKEIVTEKFDSMLGALRLLLAHMEHGDWPLPIKIVRCQLETFEAKAIPALLRLHAKELQHGGHPN